MDLRVGVSAVVMNWLILLYFIILFAERVQSIVRSIRDKDVKLFGSGFDSYVYLAVFLSLAAFLVLLAVGNAAFLQSLFTMDVNVYRSIDYRMLSITVGVILVSGMVHTEYTIPGIQFASYGMLIAAFGYQDGMRKRTSGRPCIVMDVSDLSDIILHGNSGHVSFGN